MRKFVTIVLRILVFFMKPSGLFMAALVPVVDAVVICLLLGWAMRWGNASTPVVAVCSTLIIVVIAASLWWLVFSLRRVRALSYRWQCEDRLAKVAGKLLLYAKETGKFPPADTWQDELISKHGALAEWFVCPKDLQGPSSFAFNANLAGKGEPHLDTVILFESAPGTNNAGGPELLNTENHRPRGANVALADGRVKFIEAERTDTLRWETQ